MMNRKDILAHCLRKRLKDLDMTRRRMRLKHLMILTQMIAINSLSKENNHAST